jgi:hypothetical protein
MCPVPLLVSRVPNSDRRLDRFTEQVAALLSSLLSRGYLRQTGANPLTYAVVSGGLSGSGPPSKDVDAAVGAVVGCTYVDQVTLSAYFCVRADIGEARWAGPIPATIF